jgi:hypothetical protein
VRIPRADDNAVAARQGQTLPGMQHVVVQVALARHPQAAAPEHQPGWLGNQYSLHFLHGQAAHWGSLAKSLFPASLPKDRAEANEIGAFH